MADDPNVGSLRFTRRLEAFSDLVFGFSLSLLATRLDVPASAGEIFSAARWLPIAGTFALICRFWLEHYRVFRHDFRAEGFEAVVNFVFLFAIALFPYAMQVFFKFESQKGPLALYLGDISLVFITLSILRVRALQQRRGASDVADRLADWRRSVTQFAIGVILSGAVVALQNHTGNLEGATRASAAYVLIGVTIAMVVALRLTIRHLPRFLA